MEDSRQKSGVKTKKKSAVKSPSAKTKKSSGENSGKARRSVNSAAASVTPKSAGNVKRGPTETRPNRLLTNDHHISSGLISPGEPNFVFSPCGDVPTMITDVSPVPSDVESINEPPGPLGKNKGHLLSYNLRGRLSSRPNFERDKKQVLRSLAASRPSIDADSESDRSISVTNNRSSVSVRVVTDSARGSSKTTYLTGSNKQSAHGSNKTVKAGPTSNSGQPVQVNNKLKNVKQQKSNSSLADSPSTKAVEEKQQSLEFNTENELFEDSDSVVDGLKEINLNEDGEPRDSPGSSKLYEEFAIEVPVRLNVAEDEECCKAYEVLKRHGFNVTLHTLRRALLTPTQYRELREMESLKNKSKVTE